MNLKRLNDAISAISINCINRDIPIEDVNVTIGGYETLDFTLSGSGKGGFLDINDDNITLIKYHPTEPFFGEPNEEEVF